jgi:hypothetical protein
MAIETQVDTDDAPGQNGFGFANDEIAADAPSEIGFVFSNDEIIAPTGSRLKKPRSKKRPARSHYN